MARYKKVDVRMYGDSKYRALSSPPPNGKSLWTYLLTGPQSTNIPGLSISGELAMCEALDWPVEGFRKAFAEVSSKGMARADWNARVIWIPKAIRYNAPESPNVVTGWRKTWDEVPECNLKTQAIYELKQQVMEMPEGFAKAFTKAFPEAFSEPSPNQEQEQEQEQEQKQDNSSLACASGGAIAPAAAETPAREPKPEPSLANRTRTVEATAVVSPSTNGNGKHADPSKPGDPPADEPTPHAKPKSRAKPSGPHQSLIDYFCEAWTRRYHEKYPFNGGKDGEHVKWILSRVGGDLDRAERSIDAYFRNREDFHVRDKHGLGTLRSQFRKFIATGPPEAQKSQIGESKMIKF